MRSQNFRVTGMLITIDLWGVVFDSLKDPLWQVAKQAAEKAGMKVLAISIFPFRLQRLSLVFILGESHLTIHTSPEHGYTAIDIFTCKKGNPLLPAKDLCAVLKPREVSFWEFQRGVRP